jgi:hypothetical protein
MFQYAAGLALAESKGLSLYLDVRDFEGYGLHNGYELSRVFVGPFALAEPQLIRKILGWRDSPFIRRVLARRQMRWARGRAFVVAPYFPYWSGLFDVSDNCYLVGYWQSECYFKRIEPALRAAFRFQKPLDGKNAALAASIAEGGAVSLHIRRGDYATNRKNQAVLGLVPLSHYEAAVEYLIGKVPNPRYFVFSDDIDWARENLRVPYPCEFIGHNRGVDSYIDMQLMSLCDHHIIANSSFSWWGAWLNVKPGKIVVCPRRWFFCNDFDTRDLFPDGWVVL